jgi:glycosyltransferase involved in cell wall biosynthesis
MPVYNNSEFLGSSIKSILDQTYKNFEFIILDDGSTENIEEIVKEFKDDRIRFYKNDKNIGLTKSLNICLDLTKGDIIVKQDGDDISLPKRFEEEIKLFNNRNVGLVSCWAKSMSHEGVLESHEWFDSTTHVEGSFIKENRFKDHYVVTPMAMFSREVFNKIGYYEEALITGQDFSYWGRILNYFEVDIVKEILGYVRRNNNSVRKKYNFNKEWVIEQSNKFAEERTCILNRDKYIWEKNFK